MKKDLKEALLQQMWPLPRRSSESPAVIDCLSFFVFPLLICLYHSCFPGKEIPKCRQYLISTQGLP